MSKCCRISSPNLHSSSLAVLSNGVKTSSSSRSLPPSVPPLPTVSRPALSALLFDRFFFLNQLRLLCVLAASSPPPSPPPSVDATEAAYSLGTSVGSRDEVVVVDVFELSLVRWLGSGMEGWRGSARGVGTGVVSVLGVASTSSASRYHFRRRV